MVDLKTTSFQAPRFFFFVIKLPWLCSFNEITFSHLGLPWHGLKRLKRVKFKFGFHCSVLYVYDILVISQNTGWQSVCRTSDGRSSGTLESLKMLSVTHAGLTQVRVVFLAARIFSLTYYLSTFTSWPLPLHPSPVKIVLFFILHLLFTFRLSEVIMKAQS